MNRGTDRVRERDRAALPEPMRRDVRLLGDILGEVIRDSAGDELLADVERLRHAVIEARRLGRGDWDDAAGLAGRHPAGDEITKLVGSWSLEAAEQVARAFTVYFHLANLAEEHQRIRNLRERDTGGEPVRESLAAAVARSATTPGRSTWPSRSARCASTRCSPRTPPRRGGAPWSPRCAGSAACSTGWTTSAPGPRTGRRRGAACARRSTCCGGPSQLRVTGDGSRSTRSAR